ncbi:hypothetical protein [Streptomyces sp. 2131.1]|uniref:hypothetical protein n=1 Tax=Streptomyces sp. 2131.1 TaxID=1855346 RepID=UPI00210E9D1F|nr:hypothetical protein [Streptomyces sp. 2131.1]
MALCKLETLEQHLQGLDDRISALQETRLSLAGPVGAARAELVRVLPEAEARTVVRPHVTDGLTGPTEHRAAGSVSPP